MTDPTTLSLADLAAAVVRLGAIRAGNADHADLDLLLAAANRLPGVVADLDAALELITGLNRRLDEQPPTVDQLYRAESGALLARAAEGVAVRERDAAIRRADVIAEAARSVLALAEPLIAKHSGPYPASVVADLRAVLEQPGLVDSLYAAEVLADGCGRTARLEQERDTALARVAELEAHLAERNAKNEHNRPRIDAMLKIIDDTADADCAFGDGCPLGPVCLPCRARNLLPALEAP